jgi:hypothetical protein
MEMHSINIDLLAVQIQVRMLGRPKRKLPTAFWELLGKNVKKLKIPKADKDAVLAAALKAASVCGEEREKWCSAILGRLEELSSA